MYIRQTKKTVKGKTYINYLLVESVATPKGPRQRTICTLGNLAPRPAEQWLKLAHKIESALAGQIELFGKPEPEVEQILEKIKQRREVQASRREKKKSPGDDQDLVRVHTNRVSVEETREAGPVHVGLEFCKRLNLEEILRQAGLDEKGRTLTLAMLMNRLIQPSSEWAMPDWFRRTALGDILEADFEGLEAFPLYRHLDRLYPQRAQIEAALVERERNLFGLDNTVYLYDLTSTYFEGQALKNDKARRGYSRDKRPDCKQVVVGLVVNREGFPVAHEIFSGNTQDCSTLEPVLELLDRRVGLEPGQTVVVDRGMASEENLQSLVKRNLFYIVAARQSERDKHLEQFEDLEGFEEPSREPSPRNQAQKKSRIRVKMRRCGAETHVLCLSEGRLEKDRAIRRKQEKRLLADVARLRQSVEKGRIKKEAIINERIGRIKERYPRAARYYHLAFEANEQRLVVECDKEKMRKAEALDGSYLLKTNRTDLSAEELWSIYMLLTRAENAFRSMKSPLAERPIFHQLQHRVETHIFLCVLAYHLLVAIEKTLLDKGVHTSWATVRETLKNHQICTVVLPADGGRTLKIRQQTKPEKQHLELYQLLGVPSKIISPRRTWVSPKK